MQQVEDGKVKMVDDIEAWVETSSACKNKLSIYSKYELSFHEREAWPLYGLMISEWSNDGQQKIYMSFHVFHPQMLE